MHSICLRSLALVALFVGCSGGDLDDPGVVAGQPGAGQSGISGQAGEAGGGQAGGGQAGSGGGGQAGGDPGVKCPKSCELLLAAVSECGEQGPSPKDCEANCEAERKAGTAAGCGEAFEALVGCFAAPGGYSCDPTQGNIKAGCGETSQKYQQCVDALDTPTVSCQPNKLVVGGSLDGAPLKLSETGGFALRLGAEGTTVGMVMRGESGFRIEADTPWLESTYAPVAASALVQVPVEGGGGVFYCAPAGKAVARYDENVRVKIKEIARLGACGEGGQVAGSLTGCFPLFNGSCGEGARAGGYLTSELAGASFTREGASFAQGTTGPLDGVGKYEITMADSLGFLDFTVGEGGSVRGVLRVAEGAPDAGALYCFAGGTFEKKSGVVNFTLSVGERLGTCATAKPVPGSVEACFGFPPGSSDPTMLSRKYQTSSGADVPLGGRPAASASVRGELRERRGGGAAARTGAEGGQNG